MTERSPDLITPEKIPDGVRLEAGMILVRVERATATREERRKVIVLVRPKTVRKRKSLFDPNSPLLDVTEWSYVRLLGSTMAEDTHQGLRPGSWSTFRESALRKAYWFIGYLGEIRGSGVDWDALP